MHIFRDLKQILYTFCSDCNQVSKCRSIKRISYVCDIPEAPFDATFFLSFAKPEQKEEKIRSFSLARRDVMRDKIDGDLRARARDCLQAAHTTRRY